jgi:Polyketide cyclase / dehydrase and lipid transport
MTIDATKYTSSPRRHRMRIRLDAAQADVWELVGDLRRFPEYSSGLERVDAITDSNGYCTEYTCHFKVLSPGDEPITHRETVCWYEPNRGYASIGEQPNAFGLRDDLALVTLEPADGGTTLVLEQYYDADNLQEMRLHFDQAIEDIARNLVRRFGGSVLERYVEEQTVA